MSDMGIEQVGARLVLLNAAAFQAQLQKATDALQAFNDEQQRAADLAKESGDEISDVAEESSSAVKESAGAAADAVKAQAAETSDAAGTIASAEADIADAAGTSATKVGVAADAMVDAQGRVVEASEGAATKVGAASDTMVAAQRKVATASKESAAASEKGWTAAVAGATKILKWGSIIGAVVGYEGVKKYLAFNQQISQMAIDAGVKKSQLPAFKNTAIQVSNAIGLASSSVGDMMYRFASANPKINMTTKAMKGLTEQAGNLYVLAGNTGDYDSIGRMYGAVVSNAIPLTHTGKGIAYNAGGAKSINEWALATTGHGDMKMGDLVSALGTGILPLAKTYGLSLNEVGAALDVLSPAMNASSASTRLKTAFGMLGSNSSKAAEGAELFGGNVTTMASILRSKGLGSLLSYLSTMTSGRVTGKTFATAFYGGGLGSITGGTKGVGSGAGEYLRVLGFTPEQAKVMEGPGGVSAFGKMTEAQTAALGFGKGVTGAEAQKTVQSALIGGMFGGGHTGAAIMQLVNEQGTYQSKLKAVNQAENPATYAAALKLAFSEPIVVFHQLEQQFENLTIKIGQDVTPAVVAFGKALLSVGQWFGKNKWALEALGGVAATILTGAAAIKTVAIGEKIVQGAKYLIPGLSSTSGASLTAAGASLNSAGASLQLAADRLMGVGGAGLAGEGGIGALGADATGALGIAGIATPLALMVGSLFAAKPLEDFLAPYVQSLLPPSLREKIKPPGSKKFVPVSSLPKSEDVPSAVEFGHRSLR